MLAVTITDYALTDIVATLGAVRPEQGGALLGLPGSDLVTSFVHDTPAVVTTVRYHNSDWLLDEVTRREQQGPERFKGIVHSHPAGVPQPSSQDCSEFGESLRLNPELGRYLAGIVTLTPEVDPDEHQLTLGPALCSFFGASWAGPRLSVRRMRPVVVPIQQSLAHAGLDPAAHRPVPIVVDGAVALGSRLTPAGLPPATLLFPAGFPLAAPLLLPDGGPARPLTWDLSLPAIDRLAAALRPAPRPTARPAPPQQQPVPRRSPWYRRRRGRGHAPVDLFARTQGLLSADLRHRRVLVAGVGSVGTYLAETLTRSGVGALTLLDPDTVEPANIGRSMFAVDDLGRPKAEACARRLAEINPDVTTAVVADAIGAIPSRTLAAMIADADLVIAGTDDNAAQERLNHLAYAAGVPAVFVGLYKGAAGGEVIIVREGLPCWSCGTGGVRDGIGADATRPEVNYGTGRLTAEAGLLTDIHLVSAAAAKISLALLHPGGDARIARFLDRPLHDGENYVLFATEPGHWIFPHIFADTLGQHAVQSIWMRPERRPDCPVCGTLEHRVDPLWHGADGSPQQILDRQRAAYQQRMRSTAGREQ
ncbi:ThiF family adenylyltransferase [Micromonospora sp. WMMD956]|uniref:ThiF family adenylyltransferase n=1 Tax=Micromonospora sp. WMMD956 TaxID=3016108 RepID=UPI002415BB83|nr:ThiF family adenylyltransferase [Micromonospora sp. WMMD956]MDG4816531.1 ThiF family adenylyltransferase [Micromonospora sp. WMMD956]